VCSVLFTTWNCSQACSRKIKEQELRACVLELYVVNDIKEGILILFYFFINYHMFFVKQLNAEVF
jgi:hypothetical protein